MSSRSRVLATSAAAAALALPLLAPMSVGAAAAPDAPAWGPVTRLAAHPWGESLAVAANGTVTVVWATGSTPSEVVALRRPAGAAWDEPVVIGHGSEPQVATDHRGNVTVAWLTGRPGSGHGVAVARRPAGGGWSDPVRVSEEAGAPNAASEVALAVSPRGDAVVAWAARQDRGAPSQIRSAYRPRGGPWDAPVQVTPANGSMHPQVGIDADGGVLLLYGRQRFGHPQVLRTQTRAADGTWAEPALVTREGYSPALAVDLAGDAVVVFSPDFESVRAAYRPAGGDWGRPRSLSPEGVAIDDVSLAMTADGDAVLALGRVNGRVDVLRRPPEGPWSAPERVVGRGTTVYDVLVAVDDTGGTFLGWGGYALLGAYQPVGGTWGAPFEISPDAGVDVLESTHAQVAPNGDVAVLWKQEARPLKVRLMTAG